MEQRFYKVRLTNGRVIGPLDLDRVRLFIAKDKITGLEMARLYPTGDWKDVNTYPEIAELLLQKLEGKLSVDAAAALVKGESDGNTMAALEDPGGGGAADGVVPPPPPTAMDYPGTPQLNVAADVSVRTAGVTPPPETQVASGTAVGGDAPASSDDHEATVIITPDDERTVFVSKAPAKSAANALVPVAEDVPEEPMVADQAVAAEKTAMLTRPGAPTPGAPGAHAPDSHQAQQNKLLEHKKKIGAGVVIVLVAAFLTNEPEKPTDTIPDDWKAVRVELPAVRQQQDPAKGDAIFKKAMPRYLEDTVEGYNEAAKQFKDAASWDTNNVRALCMLASSYMNLFDVIDRNAAYFNTVTSIIERERAKGVDLAETVIADVELYLMLGNPAAAFTRIVEFSKTHPWGAEMIYYLALTFYQQGKYAEANQQLSKIDKKDWFVKVPYLYGQIYEKNNQVDEAIQAYLFTLKMSKKHIKAHLRLAGLYYQKDNLPESGKQADFIIHHRWLSANSELARAFFYRAQMRIVAKREAEALADLNNARTLSPEDQDILFDYYTLKAKEQGKSQVKEAPALAKMFFFLAQGEKSLKEERIDEALASFLSAREANDKDPSPLLRLADVFLRKGDPQSAILNLGKARELAPKNKDILSKYIRILIDGWELEEANQKLKEFAAQQGVDPSVLDRLYGDLFLREEKFQEAASYLKRALQATNFDSSVYVSFGSLMFKTGNWQDAAFYMGLALRFDPFNVEAIVTIGKALSEFENLEKGVEYVQQALQTSPYKAALLNGIAEIYLLKGRFDEAIKFAENALTTDPKYALAHKTRGMAFSAMGKRKEALDALETYTNLAPLDPTGHIERQKIFLLPDEKGRMDLSMAKSELIKVEHSFPHYPGVHFMLGNLLFRTGELDKAAFEAQREIDANPSFVPAYILSCTVLNKGKEWLKALELANTVLKMDQNYAPALVCAGVANHGMKAYAAAQTMLERAAQMDSGNADVHMALGKLYYDLTKFELMKASFKKYLELYPDAPDKSAVEDYLKKAGG